MSSAISLTNRLGQPRERDEVVEYRVTTRFDALHVRYWIEKDPIYAGVGTQGRAFDAVEKGEDQLREDLRTQDSRSFTLDNAEEFAKLLLRYVLSANSVEVCDQDGNGCTVHRDWP